MKEYLSILIMNLIRLHSLSIVSLILVLENAKPGKISFMNTKFTLSIFYQNSLKGMKGMEKMTMQAVMKILKHLSS